MRLPAIMYVTIGKIEQWIEIGGDGSDRPVLLYLHGGPGGSSRPMTEAWRPWQRHFTVVHWDQRGTGLTLNRNGEAGCGRLTIAGMAEDAIELVEFLRSHLRRDKIVLVGHSWGSILGIHVLKRRSDLFAAYVGTGQAVDMRRNEEINFARQMAQAMATRNEAAMTELREIGPPPYAERTKIGILRQWADELATGTGDNVKPRPSPLPAGFGPDDFAIMMRGFHFSGEQLFDELRAADLTALGTEFSVPMFFFEGTHDQQTPIELAEEYFTRIVAPHKEFIRFEGCHHFVAMNRPDDFLRELVSRVLPILA
jgi:pimeloyl-ACP methyl ester carboxylesterase